MPMPIHLSDQQINEFAREVEAIGKKITSTLGDRDKAYFNKICLIQKIFLFTSIPIIMISCLFLPQSGLSWANSNIFLTLIILGTGAYGIAKIIDNMEIGHNLMHGQWNWMKKKGVNSRTWEWAGSCPASQWRKLHNRDHHKWTNVLGMDPDIGYSLLRVSKYQRWRRHHMFNPITHIIMVVFFEWGLTLFHILVERFARKKTIKEIWPLIIEIRNKAGKYFFIDYIAYPFIGASALFILMAVFNPGADAISSAGTAYLMILMSTFIANIIRNLWASSIIFCGHFPTGVEYFVPTEIMNETKSQWYVRQLISSANVEGGPLLHFMSGNLTYQIEHHLYPTMPSNRYKEVAPEVRALAQKYGLRYNSGSFVKQLSSAIFNIWRCTIPVKEELKPPLPVTHQI